MNNTLPELKILLSQVNLRIADIKQTQAHQALVWAAENRPTSYPERLRLEYELSEAKRERAALEAKIILAQSNKPKEANPYYAELCDYLIKVCEDNGRSDLIEEAKKRRKENL